ncbi:hypothetical protein ACUHMQ_11585 [Chitinimonas sp. PSY-7]|uniref:hypothetical protein n=1 Tax=Chitinimonas sp. PSY-7 TaxID=3459088 RepID=UPI00404017A4
MTPEIHPITTQMKLPRRRKPFFLVFGDKKKSQTERIRECEVDEFGAMLAPAVHDVYAANAEFFTR